MLATFTFTRTMSFNPSVAGATAKPHMLIADQDAAARSACVEIATNLGYQAESVANLCEIVPILRRRSIDIILLDLPNNHDSSLEIVAEIKTLYPRISIIATAPVDSAALALAALRRGASDYLNKPFTIDELASSLELVSSQIRMDIPTRQLTDKIRSQEGMGRLIGQSSQMEKLYRMIAKVARTTHPVLILGESGTGKELVARTIHNAGANSEKPFLPVDCGSLVPTLVESELFGYVKGAFTGANHSKDGLLVSAGSGTVFLDEIGELPLDLQAKLLRALQEKEVRPVGATHCIPIKARILAATNRDLAGMVERGTFRKDLFYRLNVVNLRLSPLRERREDIPLLVAHFLNRINSEHPGRFAIHKDALGIMLEYDWPGNVRELENAVERGVAMVTGGEVQLGDLPTQLQNEALSVMRATRKAKTQRAESGSGEIVPLAVQERNAIIDAIRRMNGDKLAAAKHLGIGKTTLYRKLKEYGISDPMLQN